MCFLCFSLLKVWNTGNEPAIGAKIDFHGTPASTLATVSDQESRNFGREVKEHEGHQRIIYDQPLQLESCCSCRLAYYVGIDGCMLSTMQGQV